MNIQVESDQTIPDKQLLTCKICCQIYYKPVTLMCGHTFCRYCLRQNKDKLKINQQINQNKQQMNNRLHKLSVCVECNNIIWRNTSQMKENLVVQNLVSRFYNDQVKKRSRLLQPVDQYERQRRNSKQIQALYFNKIILRVKQPSITPMPYSYSEIQFSTAFINDVIEQSNSIVITWKGIEEKKIGLMCKLLKTQPISRMPAVSKIVFDIKQTDYILDQKYKGVFLGICFVKIQEISLIQINLRNKLIVLGQQGINKVVKALQICNCSVLNTGNSQTISLEQFQLFFRIYDSLNNPHFLSQIKNIISDEPFHTRNNKQNMIYCILRLLKISNNVRRQIIMKFDSSQSLDFINHWLLSNQNQMIDNILNVKVPGKYNTGVVFFIIFLLLAFNLFQDYGKSDVSRGY